MCKLNTPRPQAFCLFSFALDYDVRFNSVHHANQVKMSQSQIAIDQVVGRPLLNYAFRKTSRLFRMSVREFAEGELRPRVAANG